MRLRDRRHARNSLSASGGRTGSVIDRLARALDYLSWMRDVLSFFFTKSDP